MVVKSRQEVPFLFIFASLGDETDRGNNLRVDKTPILLLTISALGWFACSSVVQSPVHQFTCPGPIFLWKQLSAVVLNLGCFHPEYLILLFLCIVHLCSDSISGHCFSLYFWGFGTLFGSAFVPPYSWHLCASLFLECQSVLPKLRCERFMTLCFFMPC